MKITLREMHDVLVRLSYPATPAELEGQLRAFGAPDEMILRIRTLPEHRYGSTDAVIDELRGLR